MKIINTLPFDIINEIYSFLSFKDYILKIILIKVFSYNFFKHNLKKLDIHFTHFQTYIRRFLTKKRIAHKIQTKLLKDILFRQKFIRIHITNREGPHICLKPNISTFYHKIYNNIENISTIFDQQTLFFLYNFVQNYETDNIMSSFEKQIFIFQNVIISL